MTLWSGRVGGSLDPSVWAFLHADDAELLPYDCEASVQHARRLHAAGLLSDEELAEAEERLAGIALDPAGYLAEDEDVHSAIERQLGAVGRKIHAGRSRNDQVAAAFRLYVLDACAEARREIEALALVVLSFAEAEADTLLPGYTHLQRGQPVTLGHHLLAWVEMLDRDRSRFAAAAAASPRARSAPVPSPARRSACRARRTRCATRSTPSPTATSRSTISTPWPSSTRTSRGSARRSCCGRRASSASSGCPRTPRRVLDDAAEAEPGCGRARPRQGGHGDRPAHRPARDRQGTPARLRPRPPGGQGARLRRARDTRLGLRALTALVAGLEVDRERMALAASDPLVLATDAAEALVRDGVPFREAHERVAASVRDGSFTPPAAGSRASPLGARPGRAACARRWLGPGCASRPKISDARVTSSGSAA